MSKISPHITLEMVTKSQTATRNNVKEQFNPSQDIINNLSDLALNVIEKLLIMFPNLIISSGYRCEKLNALIGGANSSQHTKGQAVDLQITGKSNIEIAKSILHARIPYDQMIIEGGTMDRPAWIHVSYKMGGNRFEILRADFSSGKAVYSHLKPVDVLK